ncbi:MAG: LuxR C-terminal-related transcriptional regulator [Polyangiaceae bacterium]
MSFTRAEPTHENRGADLFYPSELATVLEVVYRVEQPRHEWLRGILLALAPQLDRGLGISAYMVDASSPGGFDAYGFQSVGGDPADTRCRFEAWNASTPTAIKRKIHLFGACGLGRELPRAAGVTQSQVADTLASHGYLEMFGINALDPTGRGCSIAVPHLTRANQGGIAHRDVWEQLAAHIATASRLQARLANSADEGDATLHGNGRLEPNHPETHEPNAREALREAAVAIDRARTRERRDDAVEVTRLWRSLAARRWTLIDRFDRNGRRYVVAYRNLAQVAETKELTAREHQIVCAAELGHSNKLIAYELGLAMSTVATLLKRAMTKLGVDSRVELIAARSRRAR